jgi:cellulose synthase/poly-beta-1,6-N-acetylglucosamine synthase-like glycosyltransferase
MALDWLASATLVAYSVVLGLLCVYGLHRYFLVLTYLRVRQQHAQLGQPLKELPPVTIQLPMYNEPYVARRVIEAACAMDYPRELLQIQVLDDSNDETTRIARETVDRLRGMGHDVVYLHREDRSGYKAGALAAGTLQARGEFIAIFDADFVPPADMLRETIHHFAHPRVGMVQCRWDHLNRDASLLTQVQAILLDGHFLIEHTARNRTGRYMSFNGTAGIWRRAAIDDAGGWQHDTLTEDLDLSYRAQLRGWRFVFLPRVTSPAELPPEMRAFKAQQHRWTKGGAQTCMKLLPQVFYQARGWKVKVEAFFHLTSCAVYVLMVLLSLLVGPAMLAKLMLRHEQSNWRMALDLTFFVIGTGSALSFYVIGQRQVLRSWWDCLRYIPALMAIGIGIAFNNAIAAVEGFFRKSGEFVRTPKFGDQAGRHGRRGAGRVEPGVGNQWKAWAELGIAGYLCACLGAFFFFDDWFSSVSAAVPFLGVFIFGYTYVAIQTLTGRWSAPADEPRPAAPV